MRKGIQRDEVGARGGGGGGGGGRRQRDEKNQRDII